MAKHTAKALSSSHRTTGSGHTSTARGDTRSKSQHTRSGHTKTALGASHAPGQGSKGGGTSSNTKGIVGKATRTYQRRNSAKTPMSR